MPRFKKSTYSVKNDAGAVEKLDVEIHINAAGEFYANIPAHLAPMLGMDGMHILYSKGKTPEHVKISSATLEALETAIHKALTEFAKPEVTEEPVILYNIESHVSFAEDGDGNICPNAGWPGANWPGDKEDREMYGDHHAASPSRGGYSLKIGAKAMLKHTTKYGEHVQVKYSHWYKGGSHLGHDNPANLLNSWCSFTLSENPKEIPYTDEAALFFHNLLLGMAAISRQIQEATYAHDRLLALIANQSNTLLLANVGAGK